MLVDLHVHLRGTLTRATVTDLARRNGLETTAAMLVDLRSDWNDFGSFLHAYEAVTGVVETARDLEVVTTSYLAASSELGTTYVEFMLSPLSLERRGVEFQDQLAAFSAARDRALEEQGIDCRLIATAVRHRGPEAALSSVRIAVQRQSEILVGFGLTGDERQFRVADFAEPFRVARSEGLHTTAHAGEHLPADTIIEAIERLGLDRVGHGVTAAESPSVMRQLALAGTPLEICLSSNIALGLYADIQSHPIASLANAGCCLVLGTDDPGFFATTLAKEYEMAVVALDGQLSATALSLNAINASFCDDRTKQSLRRKLGADLPETAPPVRPEP